ncbi:hypothetical protein [Halorussus marinus]|nr:hypothetical protein [Halorussus marinus]
MVRTTTCWTLGGDSFESEIVDLTDHCSRPYHDITFRTDFDDWTSE